MMKILEAEQWWRAPTSSRLCSSKQQQEEGKTTGTTTGASSPTVRSPEGAALTLTSPENTGAPHLEAQKAKGRDEGERSKAWLLPGRSVPFYRQIPPLAP
jgi:hypothetical protein